MVFVFIADYQLIIIESLHVKIMLNYMTFICKIQL